MVPPAQRGAPEAEPAPAERQPPETGEAFDDDLGVRRDAETWGVLPDDGGAWGADLLELDPELDADPEPAAAELPAEGGPVGGRTAVDAAPVPDGTAGWESEAPTEPTPAAGAAPGSAGPAVAPPSASSTVADAEPATEPSTPVAEVARDATDAAAAARPSAGRSARQVGYWVDPEAVAAQQAQQARSGGELADRQAGGTAVPAGSVRLRAEKRPPRSGWRLAVYRLSMKRINPGESPAEIRERELTARVNQPLQRCHKIATLSLKGGVGKTTITATLGGTFASLRGDRVVAVDANPDRGTLSQKIPLETSATVRHLLRDAPKVRRYGDVRRYTSQGPSRLEVLASEQDPAVSEAFSEADYRDTIGLLERYYNIVLTDCGTGLMHSAMYGVLGLADQLIIVSSGSIDGARSASATMDWLEAHGHSDLVHDAVAVINSVRRGSGNVDLNRVAEHFAGRCRAVVRIPFDPHLEEGAEVDLAKLGNATRLALLELAAHVADGFGTRPVYEDEAVVAPPGR